MLRLCNDIRSLLNHQLLVVTHISGLTSFLVTRTPIACQSATTGGTTHARPGQHAADTRYIWSQHFFSFIEPILALNICSLIACFHYLLISHFSSYYCLLLPFFEYFGNNTHYILHTTRVVMDTDTNHVIPTFLKINILIYSVLIPYTTHSHCLTYNKIKGNDIT